MLSLGGRRILIADDDAEAREPHRQELAVLNATILRALTAEDALKQAHPGVSVCNRPSALRPDEAPLCQTLLEARTPFVVHMYQKAEASQWSSMPLVLKPDHCEEIARAVLHLASMSPP